MSGHPAKFNLIALTMKVSRNRYPSAHHLLRVYMTSCYTKARVLKTLDDQSYRFVENLVTRGDISRRRRLQRKHQRKNVGKITKQTTTAKRNMTAKGRKHVKWDPISFDNADRDDDDDGDVDENGM